MTRPAKPTHMVIQKVRKLSEHLRRHRRSHSRTGIYDANDIVQRLKVRK